MQGRIRTHGRDDGHLRAKLGRRLRDRVDVEARRLGLAGQLPEAVSELELVRDLQVLRLEEDDAALGDEAREVAQLLIGVGRVEDGAQLRRRICGE